MTVKTVDIFKEDAVCDETFGSLSHVLRFASRKDDLGYEARRQILHVIIIKFDLLIFYF